MRGKALTGITYLNRIVVTAATFLVLSSAVVVAGAQAAAYQVIGTGGTLHVRTAPSLSAATVGEMRDGTWIDIVCQTTGDTVVGSNIWDKIDSPYVGYVADWYTTTPAVGKYSQGLPVCGSSPPPPPTPQPTPQPTPLPAGEGELVNQAHGLCLDAAAATDGSNGGRVQLWSCWDGANQHWLQVGNNVVNHAHGLCLDAAAQADGTDGDPVQLWSCWGGANQQWVRVGNELVNQAHGLCLDAAAQADGSNGDGLQLWSCSGAANQQWPSPSNVTHVSCASSREFEACLESKDWYNGSQVGTIWEKPTCYTFTNLLSCSLTDTVDGYKSYGFSHYWNSAIGANDDWFHVRLEVNGVPNAAASKIYAGCANVNVNTPPNGKAWGGSSFYTIPYFANC
jgi:Ricin-type beta-trefoil lectin domain